MKLNLDSPIQFVKGVGPKVSQILSKLNINIVEDCFFYFPREYDDRRNIPKICQLKLGQNQTIIGTRKHRGATNPC